MDSQIAINNTTNLFGDADIEDEYTPYEERPETYIVPVVFFIIFVVGVLGNGTLVVIFLRHRAMRNVPNTYILSLALADLLLIATCVPFTSIIYTVASWPWGVTLCKISESAKTISIGVSVFTLTALSAERYCAIVNPLRRLQTKPLTVLSAILIWLLAIVLALPDAILSHLNYIELLHNNSTIVICTPFPNTPYWKTYARYSVAIKAIIYYILPLCIISCFYILMAKRLDASTREMPGEMQGRSIAQTRARRHVARMVLAFVFLFFICFFPYHLFMIWFHFYPSAEDDYDDYWHALKIVGFCLSFSNSCVNPVALYCVSGVFRQHFNRYLCCRNPRHLCRSATTSHANCETNFNSTYRRQTQRDFQTTTIENQSLYRKNTILARQDTQDGNLISLETPTKKKDMELSTKASLIMRSESTS